MLGYGRSGVALEIGKYQVEIFVGEEGSDVGFASGFLGGGCLMCLVLNPNGEFLVVGRPGALVAMHV